MYRFWDTLIEPILDVVRPKSIVEIGSDYGLNTQNLLEFCGRTGAKLHVVDPLPKYDVAIWQEGYGESVVFYMELSLEAIPLIDGFDVIFLDGDHNWYTVFNELKLIESRCAEVSQPFPLVMMHDIGWPYGRRDGYYAPDNIPDRCLNPYEQRGMLPGRSELVEEGGLNQGMHNAVREGEPRNGVLTAVEDFLAQTEQEIELIKIPGLHGLGILVPSHFERQVYKLLKTLDLSPHVTRHIERVEQSRLEAEISLQNSSAALRRLEARRSREVEKMQAQLQKQRRILREQREDLQARNRELQQLREQAWQRLVMRLAKRITRL